ncbi:ribosomal RNA processing protein [Brettanomyces nanus]|uniref:ATP-dependent rRNA helicase RRP3 n=1 Tax=Eeniella nana TaxID=13502 RepID=A0A875RP20_EENNA|nr:ribosomal RNA processing protein [Brettanomyces nanus]QPG74440.1 ribosomal RNA processing protein [Brettanomyces nanus]
MPSSKVTKPSIRASKVDIDALKKKLGTKENKENSEINDKKINDKKTNEKKTNDTKAKSFKEFNLKEDIEEALNSLKFSMPTPIQEQSLPYSLKGRDIIGIAQTGSGKTAAYVIPILQALWDAQTPYFALVLAPTRELAYQIRETFDALGANMGLRCATIVGGMDMMDQAKELMRKPHVIVATPGRLMDHLENTKGFSLRAMKYFVMDEADRLLEMEFGPVVDKILQVLPRERKTYLFSATLTSQVDKLQRASLINPAKIEVNGKYSTVDTLIQSMMVVPDGYKNTFLMYILNEYMGKSVIIFTRTCAHAQHVALMTRILGFPAIPLHGQLSQAQRLGALNKFRSGDKSILVATDVAARGLDIPCVDLILNYDIPTDSKAYIHRVGRTARAGRTGKSVSLVTQYDLEMILRIEKVIGMKLPKETPEKNDILALHNSVDRAAAEAINKVKQFHAHRRIHTHHT